MGDNKARDANFWDSLTTSVDVESRQSIRKLVMEIEAKTKKRYQVTFQEVGKTSVQVYSFDEHGPLTVVMTDPELKELNGSYDTSSAIMERIQSLLENSVKHLPYKVYDRCFNHPRCSNTNMHDSATAKTITCSACHRTLIKAGNEDKSIWDRIKVSLEFEQIYWSSGGSNSEMIKKGDIIFRN